MPQIQVRRKVCLSFKVCPRNDSKNHRKQWRPHPWYQGTREVPGLTVPPSHLQAGARPCISWQLLQVGHENLAVRRERVHVVDTGSMPGAWPALLRGPGSPWALVQRHCRRVFHCGFPRSGISGPPPPHLLHYTCRQANGRRDVAHSPLTGRARNSSLHVAVQKSSLLSSLIHSSYLTLAKYQIPIIVSSGLGSGG